MILTAHQNVFLPYLGTIAKIASADLFVIFDIVQFERHGYSNRVKIKTHEGTQWLTIPVAHGQPLLKDARIRGYWKRKHLRAIEIAYSRAPYFEHYFSELRTVYELASHARTLADADRLFLSWLLEVMGVRTRTVRASDYDFQGTKSDLVLDMCLKLGAKRYIFGPKGAEYANFAAFAEQGVDVTVQNWKAKPYPQLHGGFVPNLSALDLLMNVGSDSLEVLLGRAA